MSNYKQGMRKRLTASGSVIIPTKQKTRAVAITEAAYQEISVYAKKHGLSRSNLLSTIALLFLQGLSNGIGKEVLEVEFQEIQRKIQEITK